MADVYKYVNLTGTIVPDTGDIQAAVEQQYKNAFGDDLNVAPYTPQGMLIAAETLAETAVADNNAALANQINPNIAGGVFLDAILALTGAQRTSASPSLVVCNVTGVPGTVIPAGSQAQETVNHLNFKSASSITLAIDGTGSGVFQSVTDGPIAAASGTLTTIVSNVLGWETITNPLAATLGSTTQSDIAARQFRANTLASQGSSLAQAITSALFQVPGVKSLKFLENTADTTQVIIPPLRTNGVTMVAHSIYACISGGTDVAVANALVSKKSGGCAYNNGASSFPISVPVAVPFSGQVMNVLFDRPDPIRIYVKATVSVDASISDPTTAVKKAITDYALGLLNGQAGLTVGTNVSCFELSGAVTQQNPGIYIQNMQTTKTLPTYSNAEIVVDWWQQASIASGDITVIIL